MWAPVGQSWAKLGPKWAPDGPDWGSFTNLAYFGYDGSYYFNDYRRTKHHPMIKQTVPESLDCQEKVDCLTGQYIKYLTHSQQIT